MLVNDPDRGRALAQLLYSAFRTTGIHGMREMPEDVLPPGVTQGSREHILFITLTVALDYQRDAHALWDAARATFADPATRYVFDPAALNAAPWRQVGGDLQKHWLSKKPGNDCTIWRTVGITFHKKWAGDPRQFLADCGWSAPVILERLKTDSHLNSGRNVPDFPYLRGRKIGPLWIRMLRDNVGLQINQLEAVPIPVDVHIARASLATGLVSGDYHGGSEAIYEAIREAWRSSVHGLRVDGRDMIALDVDEPLWHLSKSGCTHRHDQTGECPRHGSCVAKAFCTRGAVRVEAGGVVLRT